MTALIFLLRFCIKAKMKARPARTKESRMSTQTHRSYKKTFYPLRPNTYHRIYQHSTTAGFLGLHRIPGLHCIPPGVIKISHLRRSLSLQRKNLWKIRRLVKRMNAPQRGVAFKKMQSESKQSLSKTGKLRPDGRRSPGRTW